TQASPRDRASCQSNVRLILDRGPSDPFRQLCPRNHICARAPCFGTRKGCRALESLRISEPGCPICADGQDLERSPDDYVRDHCIAANGTYVGYTVVVITFGDGVCRPRSTRQLPPLRWGSDEHDRRKQRKVVRG